MADISDRRHPATVPRVHSLSGRGRLLHLGSSKLFQEQRVTSANVERREIAQSEAWDLRWIAMNSSG